MCDKAGNCGMYYSPPIKVDLTPPVVPIGADWDRLHYWASPDDVHFAWNATSHPTQVRKAVTYSMVACPCTRAGCCDEVDVADNVPDPESSPVYSEWRIFRMDSDNTLTRVAGPVDVRDLPYGRYQSTDSPLLLGSRYVVEVLSTNRAGSMSSYYSKTIKVDYSPPMCTLPTSLTPLSDSVADVLVPTCDKGGPCGGSSAFSVSAFGLFSYWAN